MTNTSGINRKQWLEKLTALRRQDGQNNVEETIHECQCQRALMPDTHGFRGRLVPDEQEVSLGDLIGNILDE
jgi:hypothetical protein